MHGIDGRAGVIRRDELMFIGNGGFCVRIEQKETQVKMSKFVVILHCLSKKERHCNIEYNKMYAIINYRNQN